MKPYKILFADMDDTLIKTKSGKAHIYNGVEYIGNGNNVQNGGSVYVIQKIYEMGISRLHIVSNQGGIEKGYYTKGDMERKFKNICSAIETFSGKGYCPFIVSYDFSISTARTDVKRKPNTGMLVNYLAVFGTKYSKSDCLMIGDASGKPGDFSDSDKKCAENFGIDYIDVNDFVK